MRLWDKWQTAGAALALLLAGPAFVRAQESGVAKLVSPAGTVIGRQSPQQGWRFLGDKETIRAGEEYLCSKEAVIESNDGAVRLSLLGDLGDKVSLTSEFPIIETVVVFQPPQGDAMRLTLDRGRVKLTSASKEPAAVVVTAGGKEWGLTLLKPETEVAVETFGRWAAGQKFMPEPPPGYGPCQDVVILVLKGEADLRFEGAQYALSAPPGPAYVQWDNHSGDTRLRPRSVKELPQWASNSPVRNKEALARLRALALEKGIQPAVKEMLHSESKEERMLGVYAAAALDDLQLLGVILRESRHPDLWDHAVPALRHWIGRKPGQDQKLYQGLIKSGNFTPAEANIVLHLLHTPDEARLRDPATYELLIEFLRDQQLAIRGLAHWHLVRLVPGGDKIEYHPLDPAEKREKAYREWKELVPSGKLPPKPGGK